MCWLQLDLDRVLSDCAAQVLTEILGESCAQAVYYHLGVDLSVETAGRFSDELERMFGIGATVFEKGIIEELNRAFGRNVRVKNGIRLADYISQLQESVCRDS